MVALVDIMPAQKYTTQLISREIIPKTIKIAAKILPACPHQTIPPVPMIIIPMPTSVKTRPHKRNSLIFADLKKILFTIPFLSMTIDVCNVNGFLILQAGNRHTLSKKIVLYR